MEDSTLANPPPVPSGRASPRFVSEDRRNHAFRSLVSDIAERLSESDVKIIIWQQDIPTSRQNRISALEVLEYLYKNGFYTEYEVRPLAQLLKDIHREDLTSRVDAFWKQFGRHFSNIDDSMRSHAARQFLKGRRSTLSSGNPLIVVSPSPENPEIPTIAATTEESQESKAAGLPYDVVSSSPSSLSILSIPSIPESQPGNDHASQPEQLGIKTPPQHHYSLIHSRSEGVLRTGSSISLHRPALKHRLSEPLSSSCSQLEFPPRRYAHPDGKYVIHPHKMHHSVSQEYHHQPQKYGYGQQPICTKSHFHSDGSPSCSPSDYFISQNGNFQADLTPPTAACNCVKNLCPHCGGISVSNHQPAMIYLPAVSYPAHQAESPMTMTSSEDTRRTKTHPTPSKGYVPRAKRKFRDTDQLPSTTAVMEQPTGNQNPAESDSESDHCSSTDDQELHPNIHAKDKQVNDGSIKPTESSVAVRKSKNKKDAKRRPHSAGTGQAITTTSAKSNLHASADTLAEGINSQATSGAKPTWKHVLFPAKPKIAHPEPNQVIWPVRRDRLNKYIYKYTRKLKTCKAKLELVPDRDNCGPLPKFNLQLHPYGSEDDGNKYITAKVTIELPKKFRLLSTRKIEFQLSAREDDPTSGKKIGCEKAQQEQVTKSFFYIKRFISHEELKNCHCNHVYVNAAVKLI